MVDLEPGLLAMLETGWTSPVEIPALDAEDAADRIRAVAASDLSVLAIPTDFGGGGGTLLDVARGQRALAKVDPGVAIAINMHSLSIGLMTEYWERHRDKTWMLLEGIGNTRALVASAFAEPGGSANFMKSESRARPAGRGYVVSGVKFPCSLATTAEIYCLSAGVEGTDDTIVGLCPARSPGITVAGDWPSLGMRGSDTARVQFDEVEVDDRLVFHRANADLVDDTVISGLVWFAVLAASTYHGVLTTLVTLGAEGLAARRDGSIQRSALIGRAARDLLQFGAAVQWTAEAWTKGTLQGDPAMAAAMALRASMSDGRDRIVHAVTGAVGSRIYIDGDPVAQAALDSLACHHHPPNLLACDEAVGALATGRPMRLDPA